jgi:predicted ribosome quality control (RQC) complex YloA/Tae2 family protein
MDVYVIQVLSTEEIDPDIKGDLKLLDCEDADVAEITASAPLLSRVSGIGPTLALRLCDQAGIDPQRRAKEMSDDDIARIATLLDREYLVEGACGEPRTPTSSAETHWQLSRLAVSPKFASSR